MKRFYSHSVTVLMLILCIGTSATLSSVSLGQPEPASEIRLAQLTSNGHDTALELTLRTPASDPNMTAQIFPTDHGLLYRYEGVPDNEYLHFEFPGSGDKELDYVHMAKVSVSYNQNGQLHKTTLPQDMPWAQRRNLASVLELGMKALCESHPDLFHALENDTPALVTVNHPDLAVLMLYSKEGLLNSAPKSAHPLAEITVRKGEVERILVTGNTLSQEAPLTSKTNGEKKTLIAALVTVNHKVPTTQKLIEFIHALGESANGYKLHPSLASLGQNGETAWKRVQSLNIDSGSTTATPNMSYGSKAGSEMYRIPDSSLYVTIHKTSSLLRPVVHLTHCKDLAETLATLAAVLEEINNEELTNHNLYRKDRGLIEFKIPDHSAKKIDELLKNYNRYSYYKIDNKGPDEREIFDIDALHSIDDAGPDIHRLRNNIYHGPTDTAEMEPEDKQPSATEAITSDSSQTPPNLLKRNLQSFAVGAAVGSSMSAGLHIHAQYRETGKLPYHYNRDEWIDFALHTAQGGTRQGVNGVISQNFIDVGLQPLAAGTLVGMANALYTGYQKGHPSQHGYTSFLSQAGAASLAAGIGSHVGRAITATLPVIGKTPPAQLAGSLTGSVVGQMAYHYLTVNAARLRSTP